MQQVLGVLAFGLVLLIPLTSLILLIDALFPQTTNRAKIVIENSQGRTFLIGIVNLLFLTAIIFV